MIRRILPRLAAATAVLVAAGAAIGAIGPDVRRSPNDLSVELAHATRSLRIDNSLGGRAVVRGEDIAPGQRIRGEVTVRVRSPAQVTLSADDVDRTQGPGGGMLADALGLRITVIGGGSHSYDAVYDGPVDELHRLRLGRWQPGERYRFRVRVNLPASGDSQDSLQGARTSFRMLWHATR